jgi:protein TonB
MRLNEEGTTQVSFKVLTDGSVGDVTVAKSSGYSRLDEAAISCVGHWRYTPAKQDGNPIEASWQANVVWKVPR